MDNLVAASYIFLIKDRTKLRNFELDLGYSSVNDEIVQVVGKMAPHIQSLTRFGIYLNGLRCSKSKMSDLMDILACCNLQEVYLELKEIPNLNEQDIESFKRLLATKIKYCCIVHADD